MNNKTLSGFLVTFLSFLAWGVLPVYWGEFFYMPPLVITCYRVIFAFVFVSAVTLVGRERGLLLEIWHDSRTVLLLFVCGILVGINWSIYMYAITSGNIMQASMGYYMNPLVSALFGIIFYKEALRPLQKLAIVTMLAGVIYMLTGYGQFPLYSVSIALSFALYGAVHKRVKIKVMHGMVFEMLVLIIPALVLINLYPHNTGFFNETPRMMLLLLLTGPFTALPLIGYAFGVQRLKLITVGVIQYVSPTATFIIGIFYFKETLSTQMLIVFCFIWTGVVSYIIDGIMQNKVQTAKYFRK